MKMTRCIIGICVSAAILLTGCMKEDIDELRAQQAENADRITALEEWQASVNSQISSLQSIVAALESYDYVTGITPITEGGVEIGYTITFTKSSPITIYHGEKGDTGATGADGHSPIIGVSQDTDGKYYWMLDGDWLLDGSGAKIPVTGDKGDKGDTGDDGADAVSPQVKIDTDATSSTYGEWLVSTDGGTTWATTGVTAQGDSIFAADGVDYSNNDHVVFTLADGTTTITLPKYKTVGISFTQPGVFTASESKDIPYTSTGTVAPSTIKTLVMGDGWTVKVTPTANHQSGTIKVTAPSTIDIDNFLPEITLLLGDTNGQAWLKELIVVGDYTGPAQNEVGAIYYQKGIPVGMVYIAATTASGDGTGRAVSLDENSVACWDDGSSYDTNARDNYNGRVNMHAVSDYINNNSKDWTNFPHFKWVQEKNGGGSTNYYIDLNAQNIWYLPSIDELQSLYCVFNGKVVETWYWQGSANPNEKHPTFKNEDTTSARNDFNQKLTSAGGTALSLNWHWSSTEVYGTFGASYANDMNFSDGEAYDSSKYQTNNARAIIAF